MEVPEEKRLGPEGGALTHMMRNLEIERVTLAAQSVGTALKCCEIMARYAIKERSAFGKKLVEFGQIQCILAESFANASAAWALVYTTAMRIDPSKRQSLEAASAKLVATGMTDAPCG